MSTKRSFNRFQKTDSWLSPRFLGLHPPSKPLKCILCGADLFANHVEGPQVFRTVSYIHVGQNAHDQNLGIIAHHAKPPNLSPKKPTLTPSAPKSPPPFLWRTSTSFLSASMTDEIPGLVGVDVKLHAESTVPRLHIYKHMKG